MALSKITTKLTSFTVVRGKSYTLELAVEGSTVSKPQVEAMLRNLGFQGSSVTVLDGDDPSAASHFLILGAYSPPRATQWSNTEVLRDVTIVTDKGKTCLIWKNVAQV